MNQTPMPPSDGKGNNNHTIWNIDGNEVALTLSNTNVSVMTAIKNPLIFFHLDGRVYDEIYQNWWDNNFVDNDNGVCTATMKTIYDPCPPGFCVPTSNLYYYMGNGGNRSDSNWDSTLKGKTWTLNGENIFFPASGSRTNSDAHLFRVGEEDIPWSASPFAKSEAYYLNIYQNRWAYNHIYQSCAHSVRPVKEE